MSNNPTETTEEKTKRLIGFTRTEITIIAITLVFISFAPFIFTRYGYIVFNAETGAIGDTIGGITAPFVNMLAAYLVYKSFTAQIKANLDQRAAHNEQMAQLNKEHSFNYISNYYDLVTGEYKTTGENAPFDPSKVEQVRKLAFEYLNKTGQSKQELEKLKLFKKKNYQIEKEIRQVEEGLLLAKNELNHNLLIFLEPLVSQVQNQLNFLLELKKSNLDQGIKFFYQQDCNRIFNKMEYSTIHTPSWKEYFTEITEDLKIETQFKLRVLSAKSLEFQEAVKH